MMLHQRQPADQVAVVGQVTNISMSLLLELEQQAIFSGATIDVCHEAEVRTSATHFHSTVQRGMQKPFGTCLASKPPIAIQWRTPTSETVPIVSVRSNDKAREWVVTKVLVFASVPAFHELSQNSQPFALVSVKGQH